MAYQSYSQLPSTEITTVDATTGLLLFIGFIIIMIIVGIVVYVIKVVLAAKIIKRVNKDD